MLAHQVLGSLPPPVHWELWERYKNRPLETKSIRNKGGKFEAAIRFHTSLIIYAGSWDIYVGGCWQTKKSFAEAIAGLSEVTDALRILSPWTFRRKARTYEMVNGCGDVLASVASESNYVEREILMRDLRDKGYVIFWGRLFVQ